MRQLLIITPRGHGKTVLGIAKNHDGVNLCKLEASTQTESRDLVIVHISNKKVESLLGDLQKLPDLHITLVPRGFIALHPPDNEAPDQVTEVQEQSPIEIFLAGLQSVGSWRGFLGYAALAGVVVWIGLYTNTNYLLVAAMLIAPFAGPAMNTAIASARGDWHLLWRSLLRYCAALVVTIAVATGLSFAFQLQIATSLMLSNSQISMVAVLLPLAAGAAGAINLQQSERSSLVSGAATGMLVAASLAPPAGITGMAIAIGRFDILKSSIFLLMLQLFGINLSAATLFRLYGLSFQGVRYNRGHRWIFSIGLGVTIAALVALLTWQFVNPPNLERSSQAQQATTEIQEVLQDSSLINLVEANVRFTRSNIPNQDTLLCVIYVQRQPDVSLSDEELSDRITQQIQSQLLQNFNVTPLVEVTVLEAPDDSLS